MMVIPVAIIGDSCSIPAAPAQGPVGSGGSPRPMQVRRGPPCDETRRPHQPSLNGAGLRLRDLAAKAFRRRGES